MQDAFDLFDRDKRGYVTAKDVSAVMRQLGMTVTEQELQDMIGEVDTDGKSSVPGANPQRVSTEIIIEIKQLYSGRIASNPFIASNRRYMVYPLRDDFPIETRLLFV